MGVRRCPSPALRGRLGGGPVSIACTRRAPRVNEGPEFEATRSLIPVVNGPVYSWQRLATMSRTAVSRSFSLRPDEAPRFDRLVERLANGSPTEFIRQAMDRMEALENWRLFESLRVAGVRRAQDVGITTAAQRREAVRRALNRTRPRQR